MARQEGAGSRPWRRGIAVLLLLVAVPALPSCSQLKLAYWGLDWLLLRQAERYLDLRPEQRAAATADMQQFVAWHRRTQLPRLAAFLARQADLVRSNQTTAESFEHVWAEVWDLYRDSAAPLAPGLARLLATLDQRQHAHLQTALTARLAELIEEGYEATPATQQRRRERIVDRFESLLGDLSPPQQAAIAAHVARTAQSRRHWLDSRASRDRWLLDALAARPTAPQAEELARRLLLDEQAGTSPEYQALAAVYLADFKAMIVSVLERMDQRQTERLAAQLARYARDLAELAEQR